jgi:methylated-DNA-protein-cysteine methyltransferase-like protein
LHFERLSKTMPPRPPFDRLRFEAAVFAVVRKIPRGRVATYGEVAELAGRPGAARLVGAVMRGCQLKSVPWQRVVGRHTTKLGRISILDPVGAAIQRKLLEREGVRFNARGYILLKAYGWLDG